MSEASVSSNPGPGLAGGVSLRLDMADAAAGGPAAGRARQQLFDVLACGLSVCVTLDNPGEPDDARHRFAKACELLRFAADDAQVDARSIAIAVDAGALAPQHAWSLRRGLLDAGDVYLLACGRLMRPSADRQLRRQQDRFWAQCWELRHVGQLQIVFAPGVTPACPLLSPEPARGVLPDARLQVPPGTAWIPLQIELADFIDRHGAADVAALEARARECVEAGEAAHDESRWPTAAMRHDAWLNRRIAIAVNGIGDHAKSRGLDPACFETLQSLHAVLTRLRQTVHGHSRLIADRCGHAPVYAAFDPGRDASGDIARLDWQIRWRRALDNAAVRHRNLLAMSPASVFPAGGPADRRYCDLLPLLRHADACMYANLNFDGWNINEFKHFYCRAFAVLERREGRDRIAEQV